MARLLRNQPAKYVQRFQSSHGQPQTQGVYPSFSYNDSYGSNTVVNDTMYKLPLGGTFSLIEIISGDDQSCMYSIESEGHREGFSFEDFGVAIQQKFGVSDCILSNSMALICRERWVAILIPPGVWIACRQPLSGI